MGAELDPRRTPHRRRGRCSPLASTASWAGSIAIALVDLAIELCILTLVAGPGRSSPGWAEQEIGVEGR